MISTIIHSLFQLVNNIIKSRRYTPLDLHMILYQPHQSFVFYVVKGSYNIKLNAHFILKHRFLACPNASNADFQGRYPSESSQMICPTNGTI